MCHTIASEFKAKCLYINIMAINIDIISFDKNLLF